MDVKISMRVVTLGAAVGVALAAGFAGGCSSEPDEPEVVLEPYLPGENDGTRYSGGDSGGAATETFTEEDIIGEWMMDLSNLEEMAASQGIPEEQMEAMLPQMRAMLENARVFINADGTIRFEGMPGGDVEEGTWALEGDRIVDTTPPEEGEEEDEDEIKHIDIVRTDDGIVLVLPDPETPMRFVRVEP